MSDTHKTYYTPETLEQALNLTKELKNILTRAQDYEASFQLLPVERSLIAKLEEDKKRKI